MRGHVIVERESKEGWIFVPDKHLRFNLIVLEEEAVVHAVETYPDGTKGIWSDNMEDKIKEGCDFVSEIEVPSHILQWARYAIERNKRWNDNSRKAHEKMRAAIGDVQFPSLETLDKYYGKVEKEPDCPPELELDAKARFAVYRQIQGWILEAGGLV